MLQFLSQNRLVALGLLLIAGYGISAYSDWQSGSGRFAPDMSVSAGPSPDSLADQAEAAPRPRNVPPPPAEFYDDELAEADDDLLIDNTEGFDPSPETDSSPASATRSSSSGASAPTRVVRSNGGSDSGPDVASSGDDDGNTEEFE